MTRPLALLRGVPDSFSAALRSRHDAAPIDVPLARAQHDAYREALQQGGFATRTLPPDEAHPDCPFVEDVAVVIGGRALIARPGHPSRRGEVGAVAEALGGLIDIEAMEPPATLDGGDVLQVGGSVYVGVSLRTNPAGVEALRRFVAGGRVVPVVVHAGLHLKSAVTAVSDDTVVAWTPGVDLGGFGAVQVIGLSGRDPEAANLVRLADGRILAAAAHPATAELLERRGFRVVVVDVSEFAKADGGLTCLSIRLREPALAPGSASTAVDPKVRS